MTKTIVSLFVALVLLVGLNPVAASPTLGTTTKNTTDVAGLLSIGKVGPDAIKLRAWTNIPPGRAAKVGERIVIHFKTDQDCYVVVANVSSKGSITIVFPNREQPDNRVEGGKEYALFDKGSRLKLVLGRGTSLAKLVFYASPQPIDLAPLKISGNNVAIVIPASSTEDLKTLKNKIEQVTKVKGFNRAVLSIKSEPKDKAGLRLMGPPSVKGVRPGRSRDKLGDVTGTRGRGDDTKDPENAQ
jgi:hypothetical protein